MSIDPAAIRLESWPTNSRYVYAFPDGSQAELQFFEGPPGIVTIDHTETPPKHRDQGVGASMVAHAVENFRAAGQKVIPACPFAYRQFRDHPEWADLLLREQ